MALYNSFKYGAAKYGTSSSSTMLWSLLIDWDDDGVLDEANEGTRMVGMSVNRGRDYVLASGGDRFEPVRVGTTTIELSNYDDRYNPYNTSSPLYPNIAPGRLMQLRVKYGAVIYTLFTGIIQDIVPNGYGADRTVTISAEDGLRWLQDYVTSTEIYTNTYADEAIKVILDDAKWPAAWGYSLEPGMDRLDYWWARGNSSHQEIIALTDSEIGRLFVNASGALVFYSRKNDPAPTLAVTQADIEKGVILSQPWEIQRNVCKVTANPIGAAAVGDLWSYPGTFAIGAGAVVEVFAEFPSAAINIVAPVAVTDYQAFRNSDGTGTDYTTSLTVAMYAYSQFATLRITNTASRVVYVTLMKIRGQLLETSPVSAQDTATGYLKHPRTLNLNLEWQHNVNNPTVFAHQLLEILNQAPGLPTISFDTRPDIQFTPDVFDVMDVSIAALEIDSYFRVGKISHEWTAETGQAVRTTIKLEPYRMYGSSTTWLFDSKNVLNTNTLGW